jgi:group I intron endonuclease
MFYVYVITNKINGKKYIGMSINKKPSFIVSYYGSGKLIKQAIKRYGIENFDKEIIKTFDTEKETRDYERMLIEKEDAINSNLYYNLCCGGYGGGVKGHMVSEDTKRLISEKLKGHVHTDETKIKISNAKKGRKRSESEIEKFKNSIRKYWDNISDEELSKLSEKHRKLSIGRKVSEDTKVKLSKINSKLTREEIIEIVFMVENKIRTYSEISEIYKISQSCICDIIRKRTYKWVWI